MTPKGLRVTHTSCSSLVNKAPFKGQLSVLGMEGSILDFFGGGEEVVAGDGREVMLPRSTWLNNQYEKPDANKKSDTPARVLNNLLLGMVFDIIQVRIGVEQVCLLL